MSATELLREIDELPEEQRRWIMRQLMQRIQGDDADWAKFSAAQLAPHYAPQDSVYDEE